MSTTPEEKRRGVEKEAAAVKMNNVRAMKGEAKDERLHGVGDSPPDQGAADKNTSKMSVFVTNSPQLEMKPRR